MRVRHVHTAVLLGALGLSGSALCAPTAAPDEPPQRLHDTKAQARYGEGVTAFAEGRYPDAVLLFHEADRLEPNAALSFDVARAYEKMGDDPSALRSYREYLRRARTPDDEAAVRRRIDVLEARLARRGVQQVTVLSSPPGATVTMDGNPVGVTPWTSELAPGNHTLGLHLDGYQQAARTFALSLDDALDVSVTLTAEPARAPVPGAAAVSSGRQPESRRRAPPRQTPDARDPAAPPRGHTLSTIGIVALGTGGAALGGALVFELLRRNAESNAHDEREQIRLAEDVEAMKSRKTAARVLAGVGAALTVTGGTLLLLGSGEPAPQDRRPALRLDATPTAVAATILGRF